MRYGAMLIWLTAITAVLASPATVVAADGEALYATHCEACHGENGDGGVGVPLSLPSFLDSVDDKYLRKTIVLGRPGRVMPSFSHLAEDELDQLVATIRRWSAKSTKTYPDTTIAGNEGNGAQLFGTHCQTCHGEDGRGSKGTGVTFSRKRNLPIMAPSIANPGFLASASDTMIRDILLHGRQGTPMISFRDQGLSDSEINDLVAYIRSLEGRDNTPIHSKEPPVLRYESEYGLEETVSLVKAAITGRNFRLIRTQYLEQGLVEEGKENTKQVMIYFCNFKFLFDALAIDPRLGMFLPCRITVIETESGVSVMATNPMAMSVLFNNDELNQACREMRDIYDELLEDATL